MDKIYDLTVIGGGPGGYVAAIRAAQLGLSVCLIEEDKLGGTCLNRGCIPTKTLSTTSNFIDSIRNSYDYGVIIEKATVDFKRVLERKEQVVEKLRNGVEYLLKKNKIDVIFGHAKFRTNNEVEVILNDKSNFVKAESIIVATGTKPASLPGLEFDGRYILNSQQILENKRFPKSLIIVGGGVIGCEFASIFNKLGSKVTIIETMPKLLPSMDNDLGASLEKQFIKDGIDIMCSSYITNVKKLGDTLEVIVGEKSINADIMLVSIGRVTNLEDLCIENIGLALNDKKEIKVNSYLETNIKGIYAVGDVTSERYKLAHTATYQAVTAVENITGYNMEADYSCVPGCIFTIPEIASAGMTEEEAKENCIDISVGRFDYSFSGKALAMNECTGFVKVIAERSLNRIIGVHIFGVHASDIIGEACLAIKNRLTVEQFMDTIHAHPTLSEILVEAVGDIMGLSIHK